MNNKYRNYFKDHYKLTYSEKDLLDNEKWFTPQWELIRTRVDFKKRPRMLEIGSGYGGLYNFLRKSFEDFEYNGLELDKDASSFANKYFKKKVFKNTSFEIFTTNTKYDHIFAFEVLEHLENPITSIQKIFKLLSTNGVFVGTSPYPFKKNIYADETHLYVLHPTNWKKLFIDNGFSSVETLPMSFLPVIWRFNKSLNIRIPFYIPFKHMISTALIIAKK